MTFFRSRPLCRTFALCGLLALAGAQSASQAIAQAPDTDHASLRKKADKLYKDGNRKDALDVFEQLALDPTNDPSQVGRDMNMAVSCYQALNRINETDAFREDVIAAHNKNWRLLLAAARSYFSVNHYGYIVAGEFRRGHHRGGGRYVNSFERDRTRALQLADQALKTSKGEKNHSELANLYLEFARMLVGYRGYSDAWRLQYLTDLAVLPDYDKGHRYWGGRSSGAPVSPDGSPVHHHIPKSYEAATTDGQRWRWMLIQAMELNAGLTNRILMDYANFLRQQFGVETMARYGRWFRPTVDTGKKDTSGTYALHTLVDTETIARLATGIKRFTLPDEFNFIKIYQRVAANPKTGYGEQALTQLAQMSENRRHFDRAVTYWQQNIKEYGPGHREHKRKRIGQIVDSWGQFEPIMTHPAGQGATVEFRFRNASMVTFEAHQIDVPKLLTDAKEYLKSNPKQLKWDQVQLRNIGSRLVHQEQTKYIGDKVAQWDLALEPRAHHFDKRITVTTPLQKAGAYLLVAKLKDGNTSKIIIWINDTVIAKKQLHQGVLYFVADAITGKPVAGANVDFFGYKQERTDWQKVLGRRYNVLTKSFSRETDKDGQIILESKDIDRSYSWIVTAANKKGRLAYLGFSRIWWRDYYDQQYKQKKVFVITDRPVYRPNQSTKFKIWIRHAKYDQEDESSFANQQFTVRITNPKNEKVFEKSFKTDEYGGLNGEYVLPADATLGNYYIQVLHIGGSRFRVEEYKKPEFEVKIEAPTDPIMLGDKITATIKAKYLFGAPVVDAKVKYKILRTTHNANWYPMGIWDWFYGPGYWWFGYDYTWYPGWYEWGCRCPRWWWWPTRSTPPEVVAEAEVKIGADGTVKVEIDTAVAKELHGDKDHKYSITAEVTDKSRRTIVGTGNVLVARKPFKVYAWVDRGHYRAGDTIRASFSAQTLDNKPVKGKGELVLYRISYKKNKPVEKAVEEWDLDTDAEGKASVQIKAARQGQYRLSYKVTDSKKHTIEGAYVFCVRGTGFDGKQYRFNNIELVTDKREYAPGEKVKLMINTDRIGSTVVLFIRPANGTYLPPKILRLKGKSAVEEIEITKKDMPNFFVEAMTVSGGKLYNATREVIVPPEKRVLNVEVIPSAKEYKPGEKAKVTVKLTDSHKEPFVGSTVMAVYDKAVEYISGGSNVAEIKAFFWKWRRRHHPRTESSFDRYFRNLVDKGAVAMGNLGIFGHLIADEFDAGLDDKLTNTIDARGQERAMMPQSASLRRFKGAARMSLAADSAAPMMEMEGGAEEFKKERLGRSDSGGGAQQVVQPTVRSKFADTAFWAASVTTDVKGMAEVEFDMPENLTGWMIRTWAMGHGTKVGQATAEVVTTKDLLLRLQAPRFFVEKDEVVLSANVHNYLEDDKDVNVVLELDGPCIKPMGKLAQTVKIKATGEHRVDWRVKVVKEGEAIIRMKALTEQESDAMEMRFPVYVHGMLKMDSYSGAIRPEDNSGSFVFNVPAQRRKAESRLEIRYSPTLAGAMVDALPYLVEYPYGCTEQTLNRFLPTVMTQKILLEMGLDLKDIREKQTNLNAQEIGDDKERAKQWKRWKRNPVFDEETVRDMVREGLKRLTAMQLSDGGWGWFSGWGERSYPHTTAVVVHGLQIARDNDVVVTQSVLKRGTQWLERYQKEQVQLLKNAAKKKRPWKSHAGHTDALVYMVLVDAKVKNSDMRNFLYRDRNKLAVYAKAMFGLALHKEGQKEKLAMIMRNIEQFLVQDDENQTAWLNLGNGGYWWYWYGSEYEAHAYYLKLLAKTDPKGQKASRLVKYLLNNRKHATYWNSTRDTAYCIEAMADFMRASEETKPDMTLEVLIDGRKHREVRITADNIFSFDNKLVLLGDAITSGKHKVEFRKKGKGPIYFNGYLTNFTLEDFIKKAGLEVKVNRKYYKLTKVEKKIKVAGSHGQALDQRVEKYTRKELANLDTLKSGDLVEIELVIDSKNDYEYLIFEDMKAAGFEPVQVRSGYNGNDMGAYMELRDERVCFFVRRLARGRHSVAYRMRAEIPGRFSALPTKAYAMYAPELKGNSDEIKLNITD